MKRIVSISLIILFISGGFACFAEPINARGKSYGEAIDIITGLGIMDLNDKGEFSPTEVVSRGEFVSCVVRVLLGEKPEIKLAGKGAFSDITSVNPYLTAINYAFTLGLIDGYEDNSFKPEEEITAVQAIKILVTALGYDIFARHQGGFPSGYLLVAREKKLLSGIQFESEKAVDRAMAVQFLYNALTAPYLKLSSVGEVNKYAVSGDVNLLYDVFNMEIIKGIVKQTGVSSLTGNSKIGKSQIQINNDIYETDGYMGTDLLGYQVTAYVEMTENSGKLKYIAADKQCNSVLTVDAQYLCVNDKDFKITNVVYIDEFGRRATADIAVDADYIYNGKAFAGCTDDDLKITNGSITLIDNNNSGAYNVLLINSCATIVVQGITSENSTVFDRYDKNLFVTLNPDNQKAYYFLENNEGAEINTKNIKRNDVLSVYKSKDETQIYVILTRNIIEGAVTKINEADGIIAVDGEPYKLLNQAKQRLLSKIKVGQSYDFLLNERKDIAAVNKKFDYEITAYLISAGMNKNGLENTLKLKVFTENSEHLILECADTIILDGSAVKINSQNAAFDKIIAGDTLIGYKLDEKGKVNYLDLPYKDCPEAGESKASLRLDYTGNEKTFLFYNYSPQYTFENKIFIDRNTKIFQIPSDLSDKKAYAVRSIYFAHTTVPYTVRAYSRNEYITYSQYILDRTEAKVTQNSFPVTVIQLIQAVGEDGTLLEGLRAYKQGDIVTLYSNKKGTFNGLSEGDLFLYAVDVNDNVTDIELVFDADKNTVLNYDTDSYFNRHRGVLGTVYYKEDLFLHLTKDSGITDNTLDMDLQYYDISGAEIYIYDSSQKAGKKIRPAKHTDVLDYMHHGNNCSRIFLYSRTGRPYIVIIYK